MSTPLVTNSPPLSTQILGSQSSNTNPQSSTRGRRLEGLGSGLNTISSASREHDVSEDGDGSLLVSPRSPVQERGPNLPPSIPLDGPQSDSLGPTSGEPPVSDPSPSQQGWLGWCASGIGSVFCGVGSIFTGAFKALMAIPSWIFGLCSRSNQDVPPSS